MKTELKPCPFCGSEARIDYYSSGGYMVRCTQIFVCGAKQEWFDSDEEAIAAWNRRISIVPIPQHDKEKDKKTAS